MDDFEKRWQRIRDQLAYQASGAEPPRMASTRTLFGIRSSVEEQMDAVARDMEERQAAAQRERGRGRERDANEPNAQL